MAQGDEHRKQRPTAGHPEAPRRREPEPAQERMPRPRWVTAGLRAGPALAAVAWLAFFVVRYGPTGDGAAAGVIIFVAFAIAVTLAVASGAYEHTRAFNLLRSQFLRHRVDWKAFDAARADWERRHRR